MTRIHAQMKQNIGQQTEETVFQTHRLGLHDLFGMKYSRSAQNKSNIFRNYSCHKNIDYLTLTEQSIQN
jgi:hypothetical protein